MLDPSAGAMLPIVFRGVLIGTDEMPVMNGVLVMVRKLTIGEGTDDPFPSNVASARMFAMRMIRVFVIPGGSRGIFEKVIEFGVETTPA